MLNIAVEYRCGVKQPNDGSVYLYTEASIQIDPNVRSEECTASIIFLPDLDQEIRVPFRWAIRPMHPSGQQVVMGFAPQGGGAYYFRVRVRNEHVPASPFHCHFAPNMIK